ncbi:RNA recognition motif domain and Nucleotide-binding, alpha-beta plait domain-containing protein [Strongyloides ratti]|uniref:RNA recognition motif domain and Nucleotide-binding, alpha-beta plait domain-containing protein n=1 Tax=Strongyloides ratti TaxID=34506 RepID=A0A090LAM0_STRRB|nr:RNA recognition motif domain and Nucleotide-binding, alpha-beta plait domain-containing protein [Strongyloides ratti]CEF64585.1 RNA recognition motif domain and Nucleotide-binding, alpha-beta plait domain-containing protein [Strongyloides ratti]
MPRSRSKSFNDSNDRSRKRSRSPSYSSIKEEPSKRLHIANLDENVRKKDLEESFGKFGKIVDLWLASYAPFYAFVTYDSCKDAEEACAEMRSAYIGGCRIKTTIALPRRSHSDRPKRNFDRRYDRNDRRGDYRRDGDRKTNYRRDFDRNNYRRDDKMNYKRDDRDGYRKYDNRNTFKRADDRRDNYRDRKERSPISRKTRRSRSRS